MISLIIAAVMLMSGPADDAPAALLIRKTPEYPAKCVPVGTGAYVDQRVTVAYDVTREGFAENIRVSELTDPCFEDAAVGAIRNSIFAPQKKGGRAVKQADLETTFTFRFTESRTAEATSVEDFDAAPLVRQPPRYPESCMKSARSTEVVLLEFDVNESGQTENIKVVELTFKCLEGASVRSVEKWKYKPRMRDGAPVRRAAVQTWITFELSGGGVPLSRQDEVRRSVWHKLSSIRSALLKDRSPEVLLADLKELEEEYGDEFTKSEAAAFHQLRAGVRITAKDYAGALDDLRIVKQSNVISDKQTREAIDKTIAQLEAVVATSSGGEGAAGGANETSETE